MSKPLFTEAAKPTARQAVELIIDGHCYGRIEPYREKDWHAGMHLPLPKNQMGSIPSDTVLIQGFGDSPVKATLDAIHHYSGHFAQCSDAVAAFATLFGEALEKHQTCIARGDIT